MPTKSKRKTPVRYTSRDFSSIKADLIDYTKRYYPDTFKDYNEASFGALMLDTVAYVGDMLSFYLDYQVNESFLDTAIEYNNVIRLSRQTGYKFNGSPSSQGILSFYALVPAVAGGPDSRYYPVLLQGSEFASESGASFLLTENVHFGKSGAEAVVARVNSDTGAPTYFAVKAYGRISSGETQRDTFSIGPFKRFRKVVLSSSDVVEVLSVTDSEGKEYFEVDYLTQDVVYKDFVNRGANKNTVSSIMKPVPVPRRFTVERTDEVVYLQFGHGSDERITSEAVVDPSEITLKFHGKDYVSNTAFDPTNLIETDKLGVGPSNTTLIVKYRTNSVANTNAAVNTITTIADARLEFDDPTSLDAAQRAYVRRTLEVANEEPIVGDVETPSAEEIKIRAASMFASQKRAVTRQDYISLVYNMPPQFGGVKRCNVIQDKDPLKRNLNLYVVSEDEEEILVETNNTIKNNIKTWISRHKMVNDTVDILDARVINLKINFSILGEIDQNRFDLLTEAVAAIKEKFSTMPDLGEPFYLTDVHEALRTVPGILDVLDVKVSVASGDVYSDTVFNVKEHLSPDNRYITMPESFIWEIRYPDIDIRGTIR